MTTEQIQRHLLAASWRQYAGLTYREIGWRLGVTDNRAHQIVQRAFRAARKYGWII